MGEPLTCACCGKPLGDTYRAILPRGPGCGPVVLRCIPCDEAVVAERRRRFGLAIGEVRIP